MKKTRITTFYLLVVLAPFILSCNEKYEVAYVLLQQGQLAWGK